jgi:undecaprenyl diphosphate synthase
MSSRQGKPVPAHVGIIMDGNGRWAQARGMPRSEGHLEGLRVAKSIVREASALGAKVLTLYTFSTENWGRSRREVTFLMGLIRRNLRKELDFYREHEVRVVHSGDRASLPKAVVEEIEEVVAETAHHDGLTVNLAINYGGRDEIVRSVNRWLASAKGSGGAKKITAEDLGRHLDHPELPEPDLIIRTGREMRLSNFLLWECPYAELVFSRKLWPDFTPADLRRAFRDFSERERRFGTAR